MSPAEPVISAMLIFLLARAFQPNSQNMTARARVVPTCRANQVPGAGIAPGELTTVLVENIMDILGFRNLNPGPALEATSPLDR